MSILKVESRYLENNQVKGHDSDKINPKVERDVVLGNLFVRVNQLIIFCEKGQEKVDDNVHCKDGDERKVEDTAWRVEFAQTPWCETNLISFKEKGKDRGDDCKHPPRSVEIAHGEDDQSLPKVTLPFLFFFDLLNLDLGIDITENCFSSSCTFDFQRLSHSKSA